MATTRGSTAAAALIEQCELLVAERGFHGVSASEVVRAAGQRNNSAVAYHFGSWEGLLDAVWKRHTDPINEHRRAMLAAARSRKEDDLESLVAIYLDPIVAELERSRPSHWARFNEQWLVGAPLNVFEPVALAAEQHNPQTADVSLLADLFAALIDRLHHLPAGDRPRRVALMARFVISALAAWERDQPQRPSSLRAPAAELTNLAVALLQAPAAH